MQDERNCWNLHCDCDASNEAARIENELRWFNEKEDFSRKDYIEWNGSYPPGCFNRAWLCPHSCLFYIFNIRMRHARWAANLVCEKAQPSVNCWSNFETASSTFTQTNEMKNASHKCYINMWNYRMFVFKLQTFIWMETERLWIGHSRGFSRNSWAILTQALQYFQTNIRFGMLVNSEVRSKQNKLH